MGTFKEAIEFTLSLFLGVAVFTLLGSISQDIAWLVATIIVMYSGYKFGVLLLATLKKVFKIK